MVMRIEGPFLTGYRSGGSLSCGLARLTVQGNRIVNADTLRPVWLRGVNRSGLEYSGPMGEAGITESEFDVMVTGWGANIVRIPFNQEWALCRDGYDPEPYLAALDRVIRLAAQRGAYALLDLQWLDASRARGRTKDGRPNFVAPLPDLDSISLWRQLSRRYRSEAAVLYDIFNEPHDPLPDDTDELHGIDEDGSLFVLSKRRVSMKIWQPWAVHLVRAIRAEHPEALIFVSGIDWGYDLRGFPLAGLPGLVYSTHVYPGKGTNWDRPFGELSGRVPVFAAELGGGESDVRWGASLLDYLRARGIGWTAWSWSDYPHLVRPGERLEATAFGHVVRADLLRELV
jgi:endoglucanase